MDPMSMILSPTKKKLMSFLPQAQRSEPPKRGPITPVACKGAFDDEYFNIQEPTQGVEIKQKQGLSNN